MTGAILMMVLVIVCLAKFGLNLSYRREGVNFMFYLIPMDLLLAGVERRDKFVAGLLLAGILVGVEAVRLRRAQPISSPRSSP